MDIMEEILNKRIKILEDLLEQACEEVENSYGRDTELTIKIRNALEH
jgi:energy-converting hydrogenase A subunit M